MENWLTNDEVRRVATLAAVSLLLGIAAKYADLVNEHGMNERFKGAGMLAGVIWGAAGCAMIAVSPLAGLTYVAHVLYWFQRIKLEYANHATAGVMMLLAAFTAQGQFFASHSLELIAVFLAYLVSGQIQTWFKIHRPETRPFWRLRLRIYLIPLVYSIYHWNIEPLVATTFGMIGCEYMTLRFSEHRDDKLPASARRIASDTGRLDVS